MPIMTWDARQLHAGSYAHKSTVKLPHASLTKDGNKHTDIGPP